MVCGVQNRTELVTTFSIRGAARCPRLPRYSATGWSVVSSVPVRLRGGDRGERQRPGRLTRLGAPCARRPRAGCPLTHGCSCNVPPVGAGPDATNARSLQRPVAEVARVSTPSTTKFSYWTHHVGPAASALTGSATGS
jgi:hypothetical protein